MKLKINFTILHILVILLFMVGSQLAFILFLPAYVMAMFVGFHIFEKRWTPQGREFLLRLSVITALKQSVIFIGIALIEWMALVRLVKFPVPDFGVTTILWFASVLIFVLVFVISAWRGLRSSERGEDMK